MKNWALIFLLNFNLFLAQNNQAVFNKANHFYKANNYFEALQQYQILENKNAYSVELYYNIGNCFFQTKNFTQALFNYQKALLINPNHQNSLKNTLFINQKLNIASENFNPLTTNDFFYYYAKFLPLGAWFFIGFVAAIVSVLYFKKQQKNKALVVFLCFIIAFIAVITYQIKENRKFGIVFKSTKLFDNINHKKTIQEIKEGTKIEVLSESETDYQILHSENNNAYLNKNEVKIIQLPQ